MGTKHDSRRSVASVGLGLTLRVPATVSALALVLALSTPARAQNQSQSDGSAQGTPPQATQSTAAELAEVVVTARRQAIISADLIVKQSDTIVDSVVADQAGLLPDNSVTEVLQRVSGVAMTRFNAVGETGDPDHLTDEGTSIQIRGLTDVATHLNGQDVFSADSGRGLSFDEVTPELLKAVTVYKSVTSDLVEGGSGGQVDLVTRMPFDYSPGLHFDGSLSENYGDLARKADPGGSFLVSDHWLGPWGDFGALVDLAYSKLDQKDDFIRNEPYKPQDINGTEYYIPAGFDYGYDAFQRVRKGVYVGLQWAPTDQITASETLFYSRYRQHSWGQGVFVNSNDLVVNPADSTFDANNALVSSPDLFTRNQSTFSTSGAPNMYATGDTEVHQSTSDTLDASTTVEWKPTERVDVTAGYQLVTSAYVATDWFVFDTPPTGTGGYGVTETDSQPNISFPASIEALYNDPTQYVWSAFQSHAAHNDGEEHAIHLDGSYRLSEHGFFRAVQAGARYSDRREQDGDTGYQWSAMCKGWNGCNSVPLTTADVQNGAVSYTTFSNFFRGDVTLPGAVYLPRLALVNQYNPVGLVDSFAPGISASGGHTYGDGSPYQNFVLGPGDYSLESSYDSAAYGMLRFGSDSGLPFDGNVGLRYVRIENRASGYYQQSSVTLPNSTTELFPSAFYYRSGGATHSEVLPSVNVRLKPTPDLFIRAAYTMTVDEPTFYDLRANGGQSVNVSSSGVITGSTAGTGDPELRPMISHNWDLAFQWFPKQGTEADLDFFYKSLDDTILYGNATLPVPFVTPSGQMVTENATVTTDYNSPKTATVKGIEIGGHTFFDMLPWPWNGLGIDSNFTYVDSSSPGEQYINMNGVTHTGLPLFGLSKYNYNAVLMYEKTQWSARLAWDWRSRYLIATNANGTTNSFTYYSAPGVSDNENFALPVWAAPYGELDFGLTYRPDDHVAISAQFNNLTNEETKSLMSGMPGNTLYVRSWFTTDRRAMLSVRYKF